MNTGNYILAASMREIQNQVDVLHTISMICLVLAILFLIAAAVEFFLLDILQIILIRSGRAARKGIRQLESETFKSGMLKGKQSKAHGMWNTAAPLKQAAPAAGNPASDNYGNGQGSRTDMDPGAGNTSLLEQTGAGDTSLLDHTGAEGTSLLHSAGDNATTVLQQPQANYDYSDSNITMPLQDEMPVKIGRFVVTKNIMMIHTDEVI